MLSFVHRLPVSRLAAALLVLALSGTVRVAAAQETHEGTHRCSCPIVNGVHECECPKCRSAAAAAAPSPEELAKLPPCHRALFAAKAAAARKVPAPKPDQDCASPLCSLPDGRLAAAPQTDTFLVPDPPRLVVSAWSEPLSAARAGCEAVQPSPEPPPPRP